MEPVPGKDYIGIGVGAMVFNDSKKLLLARRGPESRNEAGNWEFPGGMVTFGETLENAVYREFQEEYGIAIRPVCLLGLFDHLLPTEDQHWVSATYVAAHISGVPEVREAGKCSAVGWFDLAALPSPLSDITRLNLDRYVAIHETALGREKPT